jgi:hypothetical protein
VPTNNPYDLVIGLDRSDRKADLHLIDTRTGLTNRLKALLKTLQEFDLQIEKVFQQHP